MLLDSTSRLQISDILQAYRRFESLPLRHTPLKLLVFFKYFEFNPRRRPERVAGAGTCWRLSYGPVLGNHGSFACVARRSRPAGTVGRVSGTPQTRASTKFSGQVPILSVQGSLRGGDFANYTVQIVYIAPESNCDLFQTDVMSGTRHPAIREAGRPRGAAQPQGRRDSNHDLYAKAIQGMPAEVAVKWAYESAKHAFAARCDRRQSRQTDGDRRDLHHNSCSHDESLNCFGRLGFARMNQTTTEVYGAHSLWGYLVQD